MARASRCTALLHRQRHRNAHRGELCAQVSEHVRHRDDVEVPALARAPAPEYVRRRQRDAYLRLPRARRVLPRRERAALPLVLWPAPGVRARPAPAIAGVALLVVLVLGVLNFNVLITSATDAPTDTMAIVLPVILFGAGALGLAVGAWMKSSRPAAFARIGEGAAAERQA